MPSDPQRPAVESRLAVLLCRIRGSIIPFIDHFVSVFRSEWELLRDDGFVDAEIMLNHLLRYRFGPRYQRHQRGA